MRQADERREIKVRRALQSAGAHKERAGEEKPVKETTEEEQREEKPRECGMPEPMGGRREEAECSLLGQVLLRSQVRQDPRCVSVS